MAACSAAAALAVASNFEDTGFSDHVARLEISGIILNDPVRDKALRRAARRGAVKAAAAAARRPRRARRAIAAVAVLLQMKVCPTAAQC